MKAKKMFKELGFKKRKALAGIQYYIKEDSITFNSADKNVIFFHEHETNDKFTILSFNESLLKAIRKQIKELKKCGEW